VERRFFIPFFIALKDCKNIAEYGYETENFIIKKGVQLPGKKHTRPSTKGGFRPALMISINVKGKSVNTLKESYYGGQHNGFGKITTYEICVKKDELHKANEAMHRR